MRTPLPAWVEEARAQPLAFAQVREDAGVDLGVVGALASARGPSVRGGLRVLMVASGGCTAAALAADPRVAALHLVDPNPAQLALARLKLRLLETRPPEERGALLGHAPLAADTRGAALAAELAALGCPADALGDPACVARLGPDHVGRYERTFAALRRALGHDEEVGALLRLADPPAQARRVAPETALGAALDRAFDEVFALPALVALFGEGATANRVQPFARHFAHQTRRVLASLPAATNPYLWQVLAGRLPPAATLPWLEAPAPARLPEVRLERAFMNEALAEGDEAFDLIHLSNILDWLDPAQAAETLDLAWRRLRPGGAVLVRQLNSTLDVPGAGPRFRWLPDRAAALLREDRSYFYRALHWGRREG